MLLIQNQLKVFIYTYKCKQDFSKVKKKCSKLTHFTAYFDYTGRLLEIVLNGVEISSTFIFVCFTK